MRSTPIRTTPAELDDELDDEDEDDEISTTSDDDEDDDDDDEDEDVADVVASADADGDAKEQLTEATISGADDIDLPGDDPEDDDPLLHGDTHAEEAELYSMPSTPQDPVHSADEALVLAGGRPGPAAHRCGI